MNLQAGTGFARSRWLWDQALDLQESRRSGRPFLFLEGWVLPVLGQSGRMAEHLESRPTEPVFNPVIFP
jgi:hypothetical protein